MFPVAGYAIQQRRDFLLALRNLTGANEEEAARNAVVGHHDGLFVAESLFPQGFEVVVRRNENHAGVFVHIRRGQQRRALFAALIVANELGKLPAELAVRLGDTQQFLPDLYARFLCVKLLLHHATPPVRKLLPETV